MIAAGEEFRQHMIEVEGLRPTVYSCAAGAKTIGIGHKLTQSELMSGKIIINGEKVRWPKGLSEQEAKELLLQDMIHADASIKALVKVPLTQHQHEALLSFVFNIGNGAFANSTLLRLLNQKQYDDVPAQMRRWNKITKGGKMVVSQGLAMRREKEAALWRKG